MFDFTRSDAPQFGDPRYQRRIAAVTRPIFFVSNMFDVTFECGHSPLLFSDEQPKVGALMFCPDCYAARDEACQ